MELVRLSSTVTEMVFCFSVSITIKKRRMATGEKEKQQLVSSTWTCEKHLTLSHTTSLFLNWRDVDLTDGPVSG